MENNYLIFSANQITGFHMKCNNKLKRVKPFCANPSFYFNAFQHCLKKKTEIKGVTLG